MLAPALAILSMLTVLPELPTNPGAPTIPCEKNRFWPSGNPDNWISRHCVPGIGQLGSPVLPWSYEKPVTNELPNSQVGKLAGFVGSKCRPFLSVRVTPISVS